MPPARNFSKFIRPALLGRQIRNLSSRQQLQLLDKSGVFALQLGEQRRSKSSSKLTSTQNANRSFRSIATRPSEYDIIETCPEPECSCAATPILPDGLTIDMESKMEGRFPYYDRHILTTLSGKADDLESSHVSSSSYSISTDDLHGHRSALEWPSKLESDPENLVSRLKYQLSFRGPAYRPDFAVSVTASTISPQSSPGHRLSTSESESQEVWIFPDFVRLQMQELSSEHLSSTAQNAGIDISEVSRLLNSDTKIQDLIGDYPGLAWAPIEKPVVLICGHAKRDLRCGILGPIILDEFHRHLRDPEEAHVGLVSHIGGHKFAGNVVLYMPQHSTRAIRTPICGTAVWYGRVEPRHVEGVVKETIKRGRVIRELLRGVRHFNRARSID